MAFQGPPPIGIPLGAAQIKAAGEQLFARLDKANTQQHVFPNALMNASFDHWQRGNGPFNVGAAASAYGPDRWNIYNVGPNGSATVTRTPLAFGDIPGSSSKLSATISCTGHSAAGDGALFQQSLEDVTTSAGKRVMVRIPARRVSGAGILYAELVQVFGSGGSADVSIPVGAIPVQAGMATYQLPVDVPSIAGKVLGSGNDRLVLLLWMSAGTTYAPRTGAMGLQTIAVQVGDIELKEIKPGYGDQVPGFERTPKHLDFLGALRFYQTGQTTLYYYVAGQGSYAGALSPVRIHPMRLAPSLSAINAGNVGSGSAVNTQALSVTDILVWAQTNSGIAAGSFITAQWFATAEY